MTFRVPTRVTIEPGCFGLLGEAAAGLGGATSASRATPARAALVTDPGLGRTAWPERASAALEGAGFAVLRFAEVEPNPRSATIERLAARLRAEGTGVVVGLGGGSVLDAAKAAAMLATNGGRCLDYVGANLYSKAPLPFLAVPTTCGTGSEVTWVSVISVEESRTKISVKGETMFPDRALVDSELLTSLPPGMVAATGADALTHALEAYTGRRANPASDALAIRAIELLFRFLRRAAADVAGDAEARAAVMEASTLAGMAFGNADVGPVHCLSEALGGLFDVPHGLTNALLLAPVMRSHGTSVERRLAALAPSLAVARGERRGAPADAPADGHEAARWVLAEIETLVRELSLPPFASLGIPVSAFAEVSAAAVANGSNPSSPRPMAGTDYLAILEAVGGSVS